jgi:hypothetical protein
MKNPSGNFRPSLLDWLLNLFRSPAPPTPPAPVSPATPSPTPPPPKPTVTPDNTTDPVHIVTSRVLLVIYDPIMNATTGEKLSQAMNWQRPDDLANGFIQDIQDTSSGLARYQIVQRVELNEFPALVDGFRYDAVSYSKVQNRTDPPHIPQQVDFQPILNGLHILPRVARNEIDEVWIFNYPYAGFPESIMGGAGAFWCNSDPLPFTTSCPRRFIVMGFSYERGVGEMLESFGHRSESMLSRVFNCQDFVTWAYRADRSPAHMGPNPNLFQQFVSFDQVAPGKSGVGTIHFAPNSVRDYDWNNQRMVPSNCYGWYVFPNFSQDVRQVNASEWGNGDIRAHHQWWLKHLPKTAGQTGGVANNWWQYIMDPNLVNP